MNFNQLSLCDDLSSKLIYFYCLDDFKLDDFKREDIARAWLNTYVDKLVGNTRFVALQCGVNQVFFCGGFTQSDLVCSLIAKENIRRHFQADALCAKVGNIENKRYQWYWNRLLHAKIVIHPYCYGMPKGSQCG